MAAMLVENLASFRFAIYTSCGMFPVSEGQDDKNKNKRKNRETNTQPFRLLRKIISFFINFSHVFREELPSLVERRVRDTTN